MDAPGMVYMSGRYVATKLSAREFEVKRRLDQVGTRTFASDEQREAQLEKERGQHAIEVLDRLSKPAAKDKEKYARTKAYPLVKEGRYADALAILTEANAEKVLSA